MFQKVYFYIFLFYFFSFIINLFAVGFSFSTETSLVINDPRNENSTYFGYSIAFQKETSEINRKSSIRLIIGAPRSDTETHLANATKPGEVYLCNTDEPTNCSTLLTYIETGTDSLSWSYAWLGATVVTDGTDNGKLLVCSPRWFRGNTEGGCEPKDGCIEGSCLYIDRFNKGRSQLLIPPILSTTEKYNCYRSYEVGLSAVFSENRNKVIFGTVGAKLWRGGLIELNVGDSKDHEPTYVPNCANVKQWYSEIFGYNGYSVCSGKFTGHRGRTYYVSGAPRNLDVGRVFIGKIYVKDGKSLYSSEPIDLVGDQLGEYFGMNLIADDITGDGKDDLIVAAPYYSSNENSYNEGRVHIFISSSSNKRVKMKKTITVGGSLITGANFGLAMSKVGDLNGDGCADIAISAPYEEDGRGAVYIYLGDKDTGLKKKFSQRILASAINSRLAGFGISISNGMDINDDGAKDIAVGSYISGQTVIVYSRPIVILKGELKQYFVETSTNMTKTYIMACISCRSLFKKSSKEIVVKPVIDVIFRHRYKLENNVSAFNLSTDSKHCWNFTIALNMTKRKNEVNKMENVGIKMKYHLDEENCSGLCPILCTTCGLNPENKDFTTLEVQLKRHTTDLTVTAEFVNYTNVMFLIGSAPTVTLLVNVSAHNGSAAAYLGIVIPQLSVHNMSKMCEQSDISHLNCKMNTIQMSEYELLSFDFVMSDLNDEVQKLTFEISVTSHSDELNPADNNVNKTLYLKMVAEMDLTGKASPTEIIIPENYKNSNQTVNFVYALANMGPSTAFSVSVKFTIKIPTICVSDQLLVPLMSFKASRVDTELFHSLNKCFDLSNLKSTLSVLEKNDTHFKFLIYSGIEENESILDLRRGEFNSNETYSEVDDNTCSELNNKVFFYPMSVECNLQTLKPNSENATFHFSLNTTLELLDFMKGKNDELKIPSYAVASLVHSERYKELRNLEVKTYISVQTKLQKSIPMYTLFLAILLGISLLVLIVYTFYKIGFFKRNRIANMTNENNQLMNNQIHQQEGNDNKDEKQGDSSNET